MSSDIVEAMAEAIASVEGSHAYPFHAKAKAALAAIQETHAIVPREPSAKMCVAGANERENGDGQLHRRKWQAMIAASDAP